MEKIFLRRRIGVLFCIVGFLTIASAISVFMIDPAKETLSSVSFDPVLIIDPGHGGEDGGAVAPDGTLEADLNLVIAQKLKTLASFCGVRTVLTRCDEHVDYPPDARTISARKTADQKQRVDLINSFSDSVLISIHQNWYPTDEPHGAQVLYSRSPGSESFGTLLHMKLVDQLDPDNRRVAAPISEDIFLMRNAQCPAVLVECGFLSNAEELSKLRNTDYQLKLSLLMLSAYFETYHTGWKQ